MEKTEKRILRLSAVLERTGLARSTIHDWLNKNSPRYNQEFPKKIKLGNHSVGWLENEINDWIESCAKNREAKH